MPFRLCRDPVAPLPSPQAEYGASAFRVVADTYVTDDAGTGVVHQVRFDEDAHAGSATHRRRTPAEDLTIMHHT